MKLFLISFFLFCLFSILWGSIRITISKKIRELVNKYLFDLLMLAVATVLVTAAWIYAL